LDQEADVSQSEESPLGAATGPVLDADERRELERLRGELVALRAALAPRRPRLAEVATGALIGEPPRFRIPDPIRSGPERRMINARTAQKVHA